MHNAIFAQPTQFNDAASLQKAFGCPSIHLDYESAILLEGEIMLGNNVQFAGNCSLQTGVRIDSGSSLTDVSLGPNCHVRSHSLLSQLSAGGENVFGPFCFIRDGVAVADNCILGAHVEAARSRFGNSVKISHRAFIGDATIGDDVIIGAGVVCCNYESGSRLSTVIGDHVVIGSGTMLVAPLIIGSGAIVAAGSTITKDIAPGERIIQKRVAE